MWVLEKVLRSPPAPTFVGANFFCRLPRAAAISLRSKLCPRLPSLGPLRGLPNYPDTNERNAITFLRNWSHFKFPLRVLRTVIIWNHVGMKIPLRGHFGAGLQGGWIKKYTITGSGALSLGTHTLCQHFQAQNHCAKSH